MNRERIKTEAVAEFAEEMDKLLDWRESQDAPTLAEFEEQVLILRRRMSERVMEQILEEEEAARPALPVHCPKCGHEMRNKGGRPTSIECQVGSLHLKRNYYTCPDCGEAFFPSGPTA